MVPLARRLQRCGYHVHLFGYPSVRRAPAQNARRLQTFVQGLNAQVVHFVGHSLGGLVLLALFHEFPDQPPGRVVLLGSPLAGSRSAARLMRLPWGRRMLGRSVERGLLGDGPRWEAPRDLGVIAGSVPLGVGLLLGAARQAGDGAVGISETRIAGIRDHLVAPASHTGLLLSPRVARQVCHFLRRGRFER
ncbi:MAG: alpha/beta hydrolase [Gammaproteobacteria bacterium]|nr:alpha/beta hydrolase [Gammaproteobacteria bacterium]NIR97811.1 alpha/beta hydrolase [Gammaproteobacteria bacterium]NIT63511.1 alpha/beta hydrolase [Gammaproteobacteria bacterium]NIV20458.1 alpha/beta hydrolase [Gammaproteobacteria bacterium]NIX11040.1 alpha/beta hydrolase [Gammaproteobacteria bacterium]